MDKGGKKDEEQTLHPGSRGPSPPPPPPGSLAEGHRHSNKYILCGRFLLWHTHRCNNHAKTDQEMWHKTSWHHRCKLGVLAKTKTITKKLSRSSGGRKATFTHSTNLRHFCFLHCKRMTFFFFTFRSYDSLPSSKFNAHVKKPLGCGWSSSKRLNLRPRGSFPQSDWLPEKHNECSKAAVEEKCWTSQSKTLLKGAFHT